MLRPWPSSLASPSLGTKHLCVTEEGETKKKEPLPEELVVVVATRWEKASLWTGGLEYKTWGNMIPSTLGEGETAQVAPSIQCRR